MPINHLARSAKLRVLVLLLFGGVLGVLAAAAPNRAVQLCCVLLAAAIGIYAGMTIRRALRSP